MINKKTHTTEWIQNILMLYPKKDPALIEKVIMALTLVEQLKLAGLNFIFKGGTSLLVLLQETHRFSIDVDIVVAERTEALKTVFQSVIEKQNFIKFEENERRNKHKIPKQHFKFFYNARFGSLGDDYILLDLLFESDAYTEIIQRPLLSDLLLTDQPDVMINFPTVDNILGDKLTVFAPKTVGIPYRSKKDLDIAKQLFDLDILFDQIDNLAAVKKSFLKTCKNELGYRQNSNVSTNEVLEDIFKASLTLGFQGKKDPEDFKELNLGIKKVEQYVSAKSYNFQKALCSAGKVAYLSRLLATDADKVLRYSQEMDILPLKITIIEYNRLNKLKKANEEAFFYWYHAIEGLA